MLLVHGVAVLPEVAKERAIMFRPSTG